MASIRLKPTSTQLNEGFTVVGAATVHEALDDDPGPPAVPDDDTTRVWRTASSDQRCRCGIEPMPTATSIASVTLVSRGRAPAPATNGWKGYIYVNATNYDDTLRTNTGYVTYQKEWTTNPATSDAWTKDEVDNIDIGFMAGGETPAEQKVCTMLFLRVEYTPLPAQVEDTRTVGSQILRLRRRPARTVTQTAPLWFLDNELLTDYSLSHFAFPVADGAGAGIEKWERRLMKLTRTELNLESMVLKVTGYDQRPYLTSHWDIGQSKISSDQIADGIGRLSRGTRSFSRASKAWIPDPSDGRIVAVADDEEKFAEKGMLIEVAKTNYVKNSAFADTVSSNWSAIASGSLSDDSDNLLFDSDVSDQSANVSGNSGDGIQQTATNTIAGGNTLLFSFDTFGAAGTWDLKRSTDSKYWNDTGETWDVPRPGNAFGASASFDDDERITSNQITALVNPATFAIEFRLTATTEFNFGCVQLETGYFATSRIVTSGGAVTRALDDLVISSDSGARTWDPARGSFTCEVVPNWNSADLPSGWAKTVINAYYDADNHDWIYYNESTGRWIFQRKLATTVYTAYYTAAVTAGTTYKIGGRWTSDEGELGLSNYTISIFVDGTKGTDATPGGAPTPPSSMDIDIGQLETNGSIFDGYIRYMDIVPFVLTDEEMAR